MPTTPVLGLPYPVSSDTADVPRDIKALADALDVQQSFLPVGAGFLWFLAAVPAGTNPNGKAAWLLCNGQVVLATDYPKLAALLGAPGGNITLPDLSNRVPVGLGAPPFNAIGAQGGEITHVLTALESGLRGHGHTHNLGMSSDRAGVGAGNSVPVSNNGWTEAGVWNGPANTYGGIYNLPTGGPNPLTDDADLASTTTLHTHTLSGGVTDIAAAAAQNAHNNLQPYLTVNYVIRAA